MANKAEVTLHRGEEKKHSVIFQEEPGQNQIFGSIYVKKSSELTHAKKLRVTIEVIE